VSVYRFRYSHRAAQCRAALTADSMSSAPTRGGLRKHLAGSNTSSAWPEAAGHQRPPINNCREGEAFMWVKP
jgi:hypothetical protein